MLTPLDIHNKEFKRSFRGYNEDEIDGFLDQVVKDYEQLYQQSIEQKETIERLSSKLENYQNMENTLHSTLIVAQQTAEEVKLNAKKSAELLIKEAEVRAQQIAGEATNKVRLIKGEYQEINKQLQIYRTRMKTMLQAQLEIVAKAAEEDDS